MAATRKAVSVLLLGSGWTSRFLAPLLEQERIVYAQTRRRATDDPNTIAFQVDDETGIDAQSCRHLPSAKLVVIVFPLKRGMARKLVESYEQGTDCRPAWLALGSTSAWSKGVATSDTPVTNGNERAVAEEELLSLCTETRSLAVLNLAGLYGGERNPVNFARRACDTLDKVKSKTSLHLIHGDDVARAIVGMWDSLQNGDVKSKVWNRRWLVTDGNVYDWWQLLSSLQPRPIPEGPQWVKGLMEEHGVGSLPRPWPDEAGQTPPKVLERALDSSSFWQAIGKRPLVGRCDDYGPGGGGARL